MEDTLTALIFYGFVALLILLRFDAKRFGAADWDDEDANDWRAWARRLIVVHVRARPRAGHLPDASAAAFGAAPAGRDLARARPSWSASRSDRSVP